jgi:hypothetical protein
LQLKQQSNYLIAGMKNNLIICLLTVLFASCGREPQNKYLTYQNIVIISDMSSRIDNKVPKDIDEIHKIVQFFKNECVKPGEKIGDKSSISFSSFSDKVITAIDLGTIKEVGERQSFINSTREYQKSGFTQKITEFENKVSTAYAKNRDDGLDLISILIEKIENEAIVKKDVNITIGIDTTFVKYDNNIYIFTDGYLEYINKQNNDQFYFGSSEIASVREYCRINNVDISKALETNNALCLPATKSNLNQYINLHILETHERDKNDKFQTYKYPKGLRDNEILEAVWRKWGVESGFKSFEWKKY